jgi:hypothetical protein
MTQLPNRIALFDPEIEPAFFFKNFIVLPFPNKSSFTQAAPEPLTIQA